VIVRTRTGRGYGTSRPHKVSLGESSPVDPRTDLPDTRRVYTDTTLPDGTIYRDWQDPPLTESAPLRLPDDVEPDGHQTWRRDKPPVPDAGRRSRWIGPIGPLPRRH
jgi:hypothetical protein